MAFSICFPQSSRHATKPNSLHQHGQATYGEVVKELGDQHTLLADLARCALSIGLPAALSEFLNCYSEYPGACVAVKRKCEALPVAPQWYRVVCLGSQPQLWRVKTLWPDAHSQSTGSSPANSAKSS